MEIYYPLRRVIKNTPQSTLKIGFVIASNRSPDHIQVNGQIFHVKILFIDPFEQRVVQRRVEETLSLHKQIDGRYFLLVPLLDQKIKSFQNLQLVLRLLFFERRHGLVFHNRLQYFLIEDNVHGGR